MANIKKYLGVLNEYDEGLSIIKFEYDFANDGGAVGALNLGVAGMKMVVHKCIMKVQTTCTSGGSATVSVGKTGTVAAFAAATAVASLAGDAIIAGVPTGGGVLLGDGDAVLIDIAVAALTAGKIEIELIVSKF